MSGSETTKTPKLTVDIVSDVMCPWCFIGQKHMDEAKRIASELDLEVRWRPFQLDPTLPAQGKDRAQYLNEKFGGEERAKSIYDRVNQAGKSSGIDFRFDLMKVSPNTLDAHRIIRWAGGISSEVQDKLVRRLFEVFFIEGGNVGDHDVLLDAAEFAGMDRNIVSDLLKGNKDKMEVQQEIALSQQKGVTGVPFFILANKYGISGAQPAEVLANAMRQAAAELAEEQSFAAS